jgi:hypothetical protein
VTDTFWNALGILHDAIRNLQTFHHVSREAGMRNQPWRCGDNLALASEGATPPLRREELDELGVLVGLLSGNAGFGKNFLVKYLCLRVT